MLNPFVAISCRRTLVTNFSVRIISLSIIGFFSIKTLAVETLPQSKPVRHAEVEIVSFDGKDFLKEHKTLSEIPGRSSDEDISIDINPEIHFQEIWGFGGSVTDACLANLRQLPESERKKLMNSFFSTASGAGFSYLRVPLGSNDYSDGDYSLDDTVDNKADPQLNQFKKEKIQNFIAFAKEAKSINPDIKIMLSPWSPPAWMKDTKNLKGGRLKKEYQKAYARYLQKSVEAFHSEGLSVNHLTILNEPMIINAKDSWPFAQTYMPVSQQKDFLAHDLLPLVEKQKDFPQILLHDHNWDDADKNAKRLLANAKIKAMAAGVALHCYEGDFSFQQRVFANLKSTPGFNSECTSTLSQTDKLESFEWWLKNQSIDSLRLGSSGALGWNLCLNEMGEPRNNGCDDCRGLVTIDQKNSQKIIYNPEFEALAFTSRVVRNGAVRIHSNDTTASGITNVSFKNLDGSIVVLLRNATAKATKASIQIQQSKSFVEVKIPAHSAVSIKF